MRLASTKLAAVAAAASPTSTTTTTVGASSAITAAPNSVRVRSMYRSLLRAAQGRYRVAIDSRPDCLPSSFLPTPSAKPPHREIQMMRRKIRENIRLMTKVHQDIPATEVGRLLVEAADIQRFLIRFQSLPPSIFHLFFRKYVEKDENRNQEEDGK